MFDFIRTWRKKLQEQERINKSLEEQAREISDLVRTSSFFVKGVLVYKNTNFSEILTELEVSPTDSLVPIRNLSFRGFSAIRAGDFIYAKIPCYNRIEISPRGSFSKEILYLPREYIKTEEAIEISLFNLGDNSSPLRIERSVNYPGYNKN